MDKKENKEDSKQEKELKEEENFIEESGGFPDDIDFKKFLGCGG